MESNPPRIGSLSQRSLRIHASGVPRRFQLRGSDGRKRRTARSSMLGSNGPDSACVMSSLPGDWPVARRQHFASLNPHSTYPSGYSPLRYKHPHPRAYGSSHEYGSPPPPRLLPHPHVQSPQAHSFRPCMRPPLRQCIHLFLRACADVVCLLQPSPSPSPAHLRPPTSPISPISPVLASRLSLLGSSRGPTITLLCSSLLKLPVLELTLLSQHFRSALCHVISARRHIILALCPVSSLIRRLGSVLLLAALLLIGATAAGLTAAPPAVAAGSAAVAATSSNAPSATAIGAAVAAVSSNALSAVSAVAATSSNAPAETATGGAATLAAVAAIPSDVASATTAAGVTVTAAPVAATSFAPTSSDVPADAVTHSVTVPSICIEGPHGIRVHAVQAGGRSSKRARRSKANAFVRLAANRVAPAVVQLQVERPLPRSGISLQAASGGREEGNGRGCEAGHSDSCVEGSVGSDSQERFTLPVQSGWLQMQKQKQGVGAWLWGLKERARMDARAPAPETYMETSVGSGFIISSKQRLVLTNAHVVDGAATVTLCLPDGRRFATQSHAFHPAADLAVLKVTHRLPVKSTNAAVLLNLQGERESAITETRGGVKAAAGMEGQGRAVETAIGEPTTVAGTFGGAKAMAATVRGKKAVGGREGEVESSAATHMGVTALDSVADCDDVVLQGDEAQTGVWLRQDDVESEEGRVEGGYGGERSSGRGRGEGGEHLRAANSLPCAPIGDSDDVELADWVISVGNPVGLPGSISLGIVSSLHRTAAQVGVPHSALHFFQTDCAINPGSSGSPLVNEFGEVIGITTAIRSDAEGVAFAIPINHAISELQSIGVLV